MSAPLLRAVLDDLASYQPTEGVYGGAGPTRPLSANESPLAPLPGILDAITAAGAVINRYPDPGCGELTAALARTHGVDPDRVLVGAGSVAQLQLLFQAVAEPGTEVLYAWRSFELYPVLAELAGVRSVRVPLAGDAHDLPAMAGRITDATRLVIVCNPNNPTGTAVGAEELEAFLDRVPPTCLIALDEAYREYVRKPGAADGRTLCDVYPNVVVLRTFSKAYGLAGLRIGYLLGAPGVVQRLRRASLAYSVNAVAQLAALAALGLEDQLRRRVDATVAERTRVRAALLAEGWRVPDGQGNFLWLPLGADAAEFGSWCAERGIASHGRSRARAYACRSAPPRTTTPSSRRARGGARTANRECGASDG
ncbi:histidinol-phosphate transaminase [Plantactinospora sp. CA-290183]|uniref:histidinol-phosphate transaminase n=1 Tax=Plantactinospora sp. CA-290183 TaxID=3240006 RepID=UPI003D923055